MADERLEKALFDTVRREIEKDAAASTRRAKRRIEAASKVLNDKFPNAGQAILDALGKERAGLFEQDIRSGGICLNRESQNVIRSRHEPRIRDAVEASGIDTEAISRSLTKAAGLPYYGVDPLRPLNVQVGMRPGAQEGS